MGMLTRLRAFCARTNLGWWYLTHRRYRVEIGHLDDFTDMAERARLHVLFRHHEYPPNLKVFRSQDALAECG
ncbi:hypothetical protein Acsp03_72260 [Actinomadura sp. NBRC 104412]|uniref:hypothetical protein n=1 Tax=Actinomadura sp. NBRC 104412 TaxID=3032203 RepID=UPI0024A0A553|nr:hypothetical protein [Actinomadura sp. NBRC 104412]GLZ09760.1 hypothetical protein Acsp03_72260 [Actinomadura sp. NBRC 104412]